VSNCGIREPPHNRKGAWFGNAPFKVAQAFQHGLEKAALFHANQARPLTEKRAI